MKRFTASLLVASIACMTLACSGGERDPSEEVSEAEGELSVPTVARLGGIAYGASETVQYTATPRYRAFQFAANAGDEIEATARSSNGDPVLWLTSSSFRTLERNDDDAAGDTTSRIVRKLSSGGTYWLVVADANRADATISLSLARLAPSAPAPFRYVACPDGQGTNCVTLGGTCHDAFQCPVQGTRSVQSYVNGTFRWEGGTLVPVQGSSSLSRAGDSFDQIFFREHHAVVADDVRRGIATTLDHNDVYAKATVNPGGLELSVSFVPKSGSPYANGRTCSNPARSFGGSCKLGTMP